MIMEDFKLIDIILLAGGLVSMALIHMQYLGMVSL